MQIKRLILGILQTNCYILTKDDECLIIDPADEVQVIKDNINGKLVGILITHYHFDHIEALEELKNEYRDVIVYDSTNLIEGKNKISKFIFEMIKTPGHKSDAISFLFNNNLFCGDFIFADAIGRCDLPTGNFKIMQESIKKILTYDENIIICPGHGNNTTLKNEKKNLLTYID